MVYCFMVCDHTSHHPPYLHGHYRTTNAHIPGIHTASARVRFSEMSYRPLRLHPKGCRWRGLILRSGCLSEVLRVVQLARTFLTQNKPPPPAPFRAGAEGAVLCYLLGLEPGCWPRVYQR